MKEIQDFYDQIEEDDKVQIFVYGTLKSDGGKNEILEQIIADDNFIPVSTTELYPMFTEASYNFPFPVLVDLPSRGQFIDGELWTVQKSKLNILDRFESTLFRRGTINVEFENILYENVLCYFGNENEMDVSHDMLNTKVLLDIWEG